jgi:acetate kinase
MAILSVNAGSSTLKFSLHPTREGQAQASILSGNIQGLEPGGSPVMDWTLNGAKQSQTLPNAQTDLFSQALSQLRQLLQTLPGLPAIEAVAHRVVHGGELFSASVVVTDDILAQLTRFNSLAPLHQPHNLEGIRAFSKAFAGVPQVACFDTAFHATLPELAQAFALPAEVTDQGVRRYGFHGLSYQYIMMRLQAHSPRANGRVLMAHLGNGASLCGALNGKSCTTSMGFSALDGLMMGTRSGSLDAGVMLYLMEQGWDHKRIQTLLYKQSGLLGVSGISADMRSLRSSSSAQAKKAIDLFTYRVLRESGAMIACLAGLDVIAFSGGIGEHDAVLRAQLCSQLAWLGVQIDPLANDAATGETVTAIHTPGSKVEVWVVPTDEGLVAAMDAAKLVTPE